MQQPPLVCFMVIVQPLKWESNFSRIRKSAEDISLNEAALSFNGL
jgi:hypothetical protein